MDESNHISSKTMVRAQNKDIAVNQLCYLCNEYLADLLDETLIENSFQQNVKSGVLMCKLALLIDEKSEIKISEKTNTYMQLSNWQQFIKFLKSINMPESLMIDPVDMAKDQIPQFTVLNLCLILLQLQRCSHLPHHVDDAALAKFELQLDEWVPPKSFKLDLLASFASLSVRPGDLLLKSKSPEDDDFAKEQNVVRTDNLNGFREAVKSDALGNSDIDQKVALQLSNVGTEEGAKPGANSAGKDGVDDVRGRASGKESLTDSIGHNALITSGAGLLLSTDAQHLEGRSDIKVEGVIKSEAKTAENAKDKAPEGAVPISEEKSNVATFPPEEAFVAPDLPKQTRKLGVIGPCGAGKTSLVQKLIREDGEVATKATVGVDIVKWRVGGAEFQVYDTAGSEEFNSQLTFYLKSLDVLVIALPQVDAKRTQVWLATARKFCKPECQLLLASTKCDQFRYCKENESDRKLLDELCKAEQLNGWCYVSSKTGYGFSNLKKLINWAKFSDLDASKVKLNASMKAKPKDGCC